MTLEISAKDSSGYEAVKSTTFVFHVYPESYWEPLAIASNNSILVEESTSIAITRYDLQVESRTEMSPTDIIYMVRKSVLPTICLFDISVYRLNLKKVLPFRFDVKLNLAILNVENVNYTSLESLNFIFLENNKCEITKYQT